MSVVISNNVKVALVSGNGITINGPTPSNLTTANIFNTGNTDQSMEVLFGAISDKTFLCSSSIDCTISNSTVPLYTAPINGRVYITLINFVLTNISGAGSVPVINIGLTGNYQEILDGSTNNTLFNSPYTIGKLGQILPISNFPSLSGNAGVNYTYLTAGNVLTAKVATHANYTTYTVSCNIFGFIQNS